MAGQEKLLQLYASSSELSNQANFPVHNREAQVYRTNMEKTRGIQSVSLESVPVGGSEPDDAAEGELKESLCKHHFSRPHRGETEKLVARRYVDKVLLLSSVSLTIFVIIGCSLPSFSLEIFGLVGVAVEFGQDFQEATTYHSVFTVVKLLFDQANYLGTARDYIGLCVLSVLFISTLLFVPIVQSIMLLKQWFATTSITQKQKATVKLEIMQAWQYLEVYLVALFVTSW
jgi:hypothetical protein